MNGSGRHAFLRGLLGVWFSPFLRSCVLLLSFLLPADLWRWLPAQRELICMTRITADTQRLAPSLRVQQGPAGRWPGPECHLQSGLCRTPCAPRRLLFIISADRGTETNRLLGAEWAVDAADGLVREKAWIKINYSVLKNEKSISDRFVWSVRCLCWVRKRDFSPLVFVEFDTFRSVWAE